MFLVWYFLPYRNQDLDIYNLGLAKWYIDLLNDILICWTWHFFYLYKVTPVNGNGISNFQKTNVFQRKKYVGLRKTFSCTCISVILTSFLNTFIFHQIYILVVKDMKFCQGKLCFYLNIVDLSSSTTGRYSGRSRFHAVVRAQELKWLQFKYFAMFES